VKIMARKPFPYLVVVAEIRDANEWAPAKGIQAEIVPAETYAEAGEKANAAVERGAQIARIFKWIEETKDYGIWDV
jgi:hypothetical protein